MTVSSSPMEAGNAGENWHRGKTPYMPTDSAMTTGPDWWDTVERLYHAAVAQPVDRRAAYLAEACAGDEALRREVESLLAQGVSGDALLSGGAVAAAGGLVSDAGRSALTGRGFAHAHRERRNGLRQSAIKTLLSAKTV
jgi:hypothetical protein